MEAFILKLYKVNGRHSFVSLRLSNDKTLILTIDELCKYVKSGRIKLNNAYITRRGIVCHKQDTLEYKTCVSKSAFTCKISDLNLFRNSRVYDGDTKKFGVTIKNIDYIVKFPKRDGDVSTICEHVASSFINNLGYNAHKTMLMRYENQVVVLMRDFTSSGYSLRSFKDTSQSSEDTDMTDKSYTYNDILYLIDNHRKIDDRLKGETKLYFWRMFALDAILANRDRHHGNWGYLCKNGRYRFAPIYDNGACLFPDVDRTIHEYKVNRETFLADRAERFPASLLLMYSESEHRNKRTNYYEIIGSFDNADLQAVLNEFRGYSLEKVRDAIIKATSSCLISENYRQFFIDIVQVRFLHIIQRVPLQEAVRRVINGFEESNKNI